MAELTLADLLRNGGSAGKSGQPPEVTYGPFGERYEIEQWQPPFGDFDPMGLLGPQRGKAFAEAVQAMGRQGGRMIGSEAVSQALGQPGVWSSQMPDAWRHIADRYNENQLLLRVGGPSLEWEAVQARLRNRRGKGGLSPLEGQPY